MEDVAEIVHRLLSLGLLPDNRVRFQPDQKAFRIVIHATTPAFELRQRAVKKLRCIGGILQGTPSASRRVVQRGGGLCGFIQELLFGPQACARGKNVSQILGETFVHPEQIAFHWYLIIGRCQPLWPAIFAVP